DIPRVAPHGTSRMDGRLRRWPRSRPSPPSPQSFDERSAVDAILGPGALPLVRVEGRTAPRGVRGNAPHALRHPRYGRPCPRSQPPPRSGFVQPGLAADGAPGPGAPRLKPMAFGGRAV